MNNYYTSYMVSQWLRDKGITLDSLVRWEISFNSKRTKLVFPQLCSHPHYDTADMRTYYPAFSLSELAEVFQELPYKENYEEQYESINFLDEYANLCRLWYETKSPEQCDEFIKQLLIK